MDEIPTNHRPKNRLLRWWLDRRAKRDRELLAVLSETAGAKDVRDADLAHELNLGKNCGEAGRGIGRL
jgi:hypothetical protein